jgi:hypothetical protein
MKRPLLSALALVALIGCGDNPTAPGNNGGTKAPEPEPPVPGTLSIVLTTPNEDDGALVIRVRPTGGLTIDSVQAGQNVTLHLRTGTERRGAVFGSIQDGHSLAVVYVNDIRDPSLLVAEVLQVAAADYTMRALDGYSLTPTP